MALDISIQWCYSINVHLYCVIFFGGMIMEFITQILVMIFEMLNNLGRLNEKDNFYLTFVTELLGSL